MINANEVVETNKMVSFEHLDVRTVTMGISLLDCVSDNIDVLCQRVHDKIVSKAKELVKVCDDIANEIGIPIVNKRIRKIKSDIFALPLLKKIPWNSSKMH